MWAFYLLGDLVSQATDAFATDFPRAERLHTCMYRLYCRLMGWSSDLDRDCVVWLHRREDESEEAFAVRCEARWPNRDCA